MGSGLSEVVVLSGDDIMSDIFLAVLAGTSLGLVVAVTGYALFQYHRHPQTSFLCRRGFADNWRNTGFILLVAAGLCVVVDVAIMQIPVDGEHAAWITPVLLAAGVALVVGWIAAWLSHMDARSERDHLRSRRGFRSV